MPTVNRSLNCQYFRANCLYSLSVGRLSIRLSPLKKSRQQPMLQKRNIDGA